MMERLENLKRLYRLPFEPRSLWHPAVLWIDEIEAGISIQSQKAGGGTQSRVFASFLTWMQEKSAFVFIAATANVIELLPPEVLRKGRFDQIFFVTLTQSSRKKVHLLHPSEEERRGSISYQFGYAGEGDGGV